MWSNGKTFSVGFSRADIARFKSVWPCSGLPDRQVWFEFDAHGDLVDTNLSANTAIDAQNALVEDARKVLQGSKVEWLA